MISGILGKKLGMTQIFQGGKCIPVTVIEVGPCSVLQKKTPEKDGYWALQLGFEEKREKRATKAEKGHIKKANTSPKKYVREVRWDGKDELEPGAQVTLAVFEKVRYVDVAGISKGRGFQGVVKRHGFAGGPTTHGQADRTRAPGSIGSSAAPSRVVKGKRMGGHMGNARRTTRCLQVVDIVAKDRLLVVKGGVPGPNNGYVVITRSYKS